MQGTGLYGGGWAIEPDPAPSYDQAEQAAETYEPVVEHPAPVRRPNQRPNRYGGKCKRCGLWVEPEQGVLVGKRGDWGAAHLDGACPEVAPTLPGVDAPVVSKPKPKRLRPNQYAGKCGLCGKRVYEREGVLDKDDDDRWVVFHHEGECPTAFPFPEGRYATSDPETGEVKFYHCAEDGEVYVMASDNEHRLERPVAQAVIAQIALAPAECSKRYGIEFGVCGVCNRGLTSEWRKIGIGPVCNEKAAW